MEKGRSLPAEPRSEIVDIETSSIIMSRQWQWNRGTDQAACTHLFISIWCVYVTIHASYGWQKSNSLPYRLHNCYVNGIVLLVSVSVFHKIWRYSHIRSIMYLHHLLRNKIKRLLKMRRP